MKIIVLMYFILGHRANLEDGVDFGMKINLMEVGKLSRDQDAVLGCRRGGARTH